MGTVIELVHRSRDNHQPDAPELAAFLALVRFAHAERPVVFAVQARHLVTCLESRDGPESALRPLRKFIQEWDRT